MSRIGKKPITIPKGVTVAIKDRELEVKGTKGVLKTPIPEGVTFKLEGDELIAERASNEQTALHGLARALANNAILGVVQGFSKQMDVVGVGYDEYTPEQRAQVIADFPRGDFKNEFVEVQTCSALKKPQTTFGTVNVDYIEDRDPRFRKPNACTRIRNTPWHS